MKIGKSLFFFRGIVVVLCIGITVDCLSIQEDVKDPDKNEPKKVEESVSLVQKIPKTIDLTQKSVWNNSFYSKYNVRKFESIPKLRSRIDLKNIDYPLLHAAIFYETNKKREQMNLPPLKFSQALEKAAIHHSRDMVKMNFYSHTSPVPGRETPQKRMAAVGIQGGATGENLNIGFGIAYEGGRPVFVTAKDNQNYFSYDQGGSFLPPQTYRSLSISIVEKWMNSPGHRRNILEPNFVFQGIGAVHYKDPKFFNMDKFKVTQKFSSILEASKQ